MPSYTRAGPLKRAILLFWSLWTTIVVLMNTGDVLRVLGLLPENTAFASRNYQAIVHATRPFGLPPWLDLVLLLAATLWEAAAAILFWRALARYGRVAPLRWQSVYLAFTALFLLFCSFILADEVFHDYKIEGDHRGVALLLLGSILVMHLLPDRDGQG
jgi:hypothetical protein